VGSFTHYILLPEDRMSAVEERGPGVLTEDEVANLLLNPFALHDLVDLIGTRLPDWWIEPTAEAGRAFSRRHNLLIKRPDLKQRRRKKRKRVAAMRDRDAGAKGQARVEQKGNTIEIHLDAASPLKRRLAEDLCGDPDRDVKLTLHGRRAGEGGGCMAELEVSPAPVKGNVTLTIDIKGHVRTFTAEVPASVRLDPEADVPDRVFARAAEPVPEEAVHLAGAQEWREGWPPHLVLR
jgi:hypothetical protein